MKLKELVKEDWTVHEGDSPEVPGIVYDSRMVGRGDLFVSVKGGKCDGHDFIGDAIKRGASAVVYERSCDTIEGLMRAHPEITWIGVDDARDALAHLSSRFYRDPSEDVSVISITGTNGKTTTSYLIKGILEAWGKGVGLVGTIQYMIREEVFDAPHTTPESADLQRLIREMADRGCDFVIGEVSSHALAQKRADYTRIGVAVFTNLTRDHLDFHGSMEEYARAKERLFTELLVEGGTAVINIDDAFGKQLAERLRSGGPSGRALRVITYSVGSEGADLTVSRVRTSMNGTSCTVRISSGGEVREEAVTSPLVGITNLYNMLGAVGAAIAVGVPWEAITRGIAGVKVVKGRFETVSLGQRFLAVVDYAHTEDALERLLQTTREVVTPVGAGKGRVITVFGCGGNRDRGKRPKMGGVATRLSDFVIITSDNPRHEDPREIIGDIEEGVGGGNYMVIPDRAVAITCAVALAAPGDCVVVAGKGHEEYQEVAGTRTPFSDRKFLEHAIRLLQGPRDRAGCRAHKTLIASPFPDELGR
ncbi:MAG: UDP-N-acetylmuramoyl-L-alanyl-D-glutamate--2,6-diaminopimelate ligase [Chloroflexota bacterium]